ncbi:class I SAM-dependent methyltransferase [Actinopolymorpha singaporensis]
MPDAQFAESRLAEIYDWVDSDRSDLDVYAAMVAEFGARSVLDVGCGTGTFACLLAERGVEVVGVDPAAASLEVARRKSGADRVRWLHGDAATLPPMRVDLATMTGNVAQVFLTDDDWAATLRGVRAALAPDGRLVFETRVPERQAWREWNPRHSRSRTHIPGIGAVDTWVETTEVSGSLVSFQGTYVFETDGSVHTSRSTLRFRSREEVEESLAASGFAVEEIRDAPDRPGREYVFVTRRVGRDASWDQPPSSPRRGWVSPPRSGAPRR